MNIYRTEQIDKQMAFVNTLLTAIEAKESQNLSVSEILEENRKDNPDLSFEKATMIGMQKNARESLLRMTAMAVNLDRICVMTDDMADEMKDKKKAKLYRKRLNFLLENFKPIFEDLNISRKDIKIYAPRA